MIYLEIFARIETLFPDQAKMHGKAHDCMVDYCSMHNLHFHRPWWSDAGAIAEFTLGLRLQRPAFEYIFNAVWK